MNNQYFINEISDVVTNGNMAILSNRFTGKWIKIPIECYEAIKYSIENSIPVNNIIDIFKDVNDQKYFQKVLYNLKDIGLLDEQVIHNLKFSYVPKIVLSITNRCNLKCDYCCVDSTIDNEDILSTEDLKVAIDHVLKLHPQNIILSGGEPLIRKDFFQIINYIKNKYDGKIILCTNATLIKDKDIEYIVDNIHALEISIDGFDEKSCSKVRGKEVFNKVINVIKLLKSNNMKNISLSMVVGKHNANTIDNFYKLNESLGTNAVIRNFSSIGRGYYSSEKYLEDGQLYYIQKDNYSDINDIKSDHCQAGNSQLFVNYDGNIYLCPILQYEDFKIGDIFSLTDELIGKIYKRDLHAFNNFDDLKPKNHISCKSCNLNIFCTGCPAKMYLLKQDKKAFYYNCKHTRENLTKKIW